MLSKFSAILGLAGVAGVLFFPYVKQRVEHVVMHSNIVHPGPTSTQWDGNTQPCFKKHS